MCFQLFSTILELMETLTKTNGFSSFWLAAGSPVAGIGENTQGNKGVLIVSVGGGFAVCRAGSAGGEKPTGKQMCFRISSSPADRRLRCRVEKMHGNQWGSTVSVFAALRDFRKMHET